MNIDNTILIDELRKTIDLEYLSKNYNKASVLLDRLENITILNNKDYFLKGEIYEKLNNIQEAKKSFYAALKKTPRSKKNLKRYIKFMETHEQKINLEKALIKICNLKIAKSLNIRKYLISQYFKNRRYDLALIFLLETNLFFQMTWKYF